MSEPDEFDAQTERLLPCLITCGVELHPHERHDHYATCPAFYRPAVAAALRAADSDRHQQLLWCDAKWKTIVDAKDKELADLRADNERLTIMLATEEGRTVNLYTYRNRIAELEKQLADLRAANKAQCEQILSLVEIHSTDDAVIKLNKELADLRAELDNSTDVAKLRKLMAEKYGASSACDILHKELAELRAECAQLRLHLESGFMPGTYARLKNLQDAERERDDLKARLAEAEKLGMERAIEIARERKQTLSGFVRNVVKVDDFVSAIRYELEKKP